MDAANDLNMICRDDKFSSEEALKNLGLIKSLWTDHGNVQQIFHPENKKKVTTKYVSEMMKKFQVESEQDTSSGLDFIKPD